MLTDNICHFVPFHKDYYSLSTVNFVLETEFKPFSKLKTDSLYKMYLVIEGKGFLHTVGDKTALSRGDVFFTFPAVPFEIESSTEDFKYIYISFLGERGNMLLDELQISSENFIFHNFEHLIEFWSRCIVIGDQYLGIKSESVLLYSFADLGECLSKKSNSKQTHTKVYQLVKKYIDDNYADSGLSLEVISRELGYNKKYISTAFKKHMHVGVIKYLQTIRIQHACTLISQGFESISDIGLQSGFSDSLYFSKVFKSIMAVSPKQHIKNIKSQKNKEVNISNI